jgi:plastocyanin
MSARAIAVAAAVLVLGASGAAVAQHHAAATAAVNVELTFDKVVPEHVDVITGDSVSWTNVSARAHTVTADDGAFDSGRLVSDSHYQRTFAAPGIVAYHCKLHPSVAGVVSVHDLLLFAPRQAAAPGREFPLPGRTALPAHTTVTIEADSGKGYAPVTSAEVDDDGSFLAKVTPATTATYRAVAGDVASPEVTLVALDRRVAISVARARRGSVVTAKVQPASPGATVVLSLKLRDHFGWWPVQRARLNRDSVARFTVRTRRRVPARVVLTLPDGATPLAISRTVTINRR